MMPVRTRPEFRKRYGGEANHFQNVLKHVMMPAVELAGFTPKPPAWTGSTNILADIIRELQAADIVLVDLSTNNPNVLIELGMRTGLDKPICLVWDGHNDLPFDARTINTLKYVAHPASEIDAQVELIAEHIRETAASSSDGRNPLWKYFGRPAEPEPTSETGPVVSEPPPSGGVLEFLGAMWPDARLIDAPKHRSREGYVIELAHTQAEVSKALRANAIDHERPRWGRDRVMKVHINDPEDREVATAIVSQVLLGSDTMWEVS